MLCNSDLNTAWHALYIVRSVDKTGYFLDSLITRESLRGHTTSLHKNIMLFQEY